MKILVIHGPNLNMLGKRDQAIYGDETLSTINHRINQRASELSVETECFQANGEGAIIDFLQQSALGASGIIINPGAYGHYSYAIHDALLDTRLPIVEVHLSNIHAREDWRRLSVIAPVTQGAISGFGWRSYISALDTLVAILNDLD